ncbi:MAG: hypothetical protein IJ125_02350 [Atopobiaceae bacterium]|nr:hypothetical protein [Atopobiaceae bacterium]
MSIRLRLYGDRVSHIQDLPDIEEKTFSFILEKHQYDLSRDYAITMVVLNNQWCFSASREYEVLKGESSHFERNILSGDMLTIRFAKDNVEIHVVMVQDSRELQASQKYMIGKQEHVLSVVIGSDESCHVVVRGVPQLQKRHAEIAFVEETVGGYWIIRPYAPCYISGRIVDGEQPLNFGDVIDIYGLQVVFLTELISVVLAPWPEATVTCSLNTADDSTLRWISNLAVSSSGGVTDEYYRPAPREISEYEQEELEIEGPPAPQHLRQRSVLSVIGPAFTMVLPMAAGVLLTGMGSGPAGLIMMGGSSVGMALWGVKNLRDEKKLARAEEERRRERYKDYLIKRGNELETSLAHNKSELLRMYPSAQDSLSYSVEEGELWTRNSRQSDYWFVRVGLGDLESLRPVKIPPDRFTLIEDDLAEEPARSKSRCEKMKGVPIGVILAVHPLIGVVGGDSKVGCYPVLRSLISQLVANYSYADLKLVLLCNSGFAEDRELLASLKWLPHIWSDDQSMRYTADDVDSAKEVLNELGPMLQDRWNADQGKKEERHTTRYVFVCTDESLLANSLAAVYLSHASENMGTNLILCADKRSKLPNSCEFILENTTDFKGMYETKDARKNWKSIHLDKVENRDIDRFAREIAGVQIRMSNSQGEIPNAITFLDMFGVHDISELNILDRWRKSRSYNELIAPVGVGADGVLCNLDIHERAAGPHGLVAGTTGSGKSESLMTWILSLAVNYSPEDVSFLLVDFKGGGLVNQFENASYRLPHLAGSITNLGGSQINRALVSIKSENERRQRVLADAGANDIYDYAKLYHNGEVKKPLPHLIIAVDEFAELKKQFPDFMAELVSVAAIGRSLGVHLVLATQKPSGVVDDKISSNSRFRLCLKVQTPQDSKDMLQRADAAYITQKGRGILRVGNDEFYEMFQSAWSRAPYPSDSLASHAELACLLSLTGQTKVAGEHHIAIQREQEAISWASQLCTLLSESLQAEGVTPAQYGAQTRVATRVNERFYESSAQHAWEVQRSDSNDERIANLVRVYELCLNQSTTETVEAERLLELSRSMGLALPERATQTQLGAIVDLLQRISSENGLDLLDTLWLPELPEYLYLTDLYDKGLVQGYLNSGNNPSGSIETCIGLLDDPEHQYQAPVIIDIASMGHLAIFGIGMSGKSTLLQSMFFSLMSRYSPESLNIYCIDFSNRKLEALRDAPHMGGILFEEDGDAIGKLFYLLDGILSERKRGLQGRSFAQYAAQSKEPTPAIVLAIDGYGSFQEKTGGNYEKAVLTLAKEGPAYGIHLVVTDTGISMSELPSKLADLIKGRLALEMNGMYDYREVLNIPRSEVYPREGVAGRGLVIQDGRPLEFQTALAIKEDDDLLMTERIRERCRAMNEDARSAYRAKRIPRIPENPTLSEFMDLPEVASMLADNRSLPIGYERTSAQAYGLDLSKIFSFVVSGKERGGRRNFMSLLMVMAAQKQGKIFVFGKGAGPLRVTAEQLGATYYADERDYENFFNVFHADLKRRNEKKHALELEGLDSEDLFAAMADEEKIFIFIEDLAEFTTALYSPSTDARDVSQFYEVFVDKAWYHQIYIFAGLDQSQTNVDRSTRVYSGVTRDKTGAHFGGNVAAQQLLRFDYITGYGAQSKAEDASVALLATSDAYPDGCAVIVPNVDVVSLSDLKGSEDGVLKTPLEEVSDAEV